MAWQTNIDPTPRVDTGTITEWLADNSEPLFRNSLGLAVLRKNGGIAYNQKGKSFEWGIYHDRARASAYDPYSDQPATFARRNQIATAELPIRALRMAESVLEIEKIQAGGSGSRMKYVLNRLERLHKDFMEDIPAHMWADGNATGSNDLHGYDTLFGTTSAAVSDGYVGNVAGDYAGHSMAYGVFGGGWTAPSSSAFPFVGTASECDYNYHNWTPFHVDTTNALWSGTTDTWAACWKEQLRFMFGHMANLNKQRPDIVVVSEKMLQDAKGSLESNERFDVNTNTLAAKMGFNTVSYEGIEIVSDFYCPDGQGIALTYDKMKFLCATGQLITTNEEFDIDNDTDKMKLKLYGNLQFVEPCAFGLLSSLT